MRNLFISRGSSSCQGPAGATLWRRPSSSARKVWVDAKTKAAKENGNKDLWKDNKVKDLGLGPALDAYDAADTRFVAYEAKFNENTATRPQKDQFIKLAAARDKLAGKVTQICRNYKAETRLLKNRGYLTEAVWGRLENAFVHITGEVAMDGAAKKQHTHMLERLRK